MKVFNLKNSVAVIGALTLAANTLTASAAVTGHLDVFSKYVLRGITTTYGPTAPVSGQPKGNVIGDAPESEIPSLMGGLDYSSESGIYLGYAFATINYSYADFSIGSKGGSVEHDTYGGYAGKMGDIGYKVGLLHLNYEPGANSTGSEAMFGLSYKDFSFTYQPFLNETTYAHKGDTYITATYATTVSDVGLSAAFGYYTYNKTGDYFDQTANANAVGAAFRHLILGATYPFAKNVTGGASYIIGGQNRYGVQQENQLVGNLSYTF